MTTSPDSSGSNNRDMLLQGNVSNSSGQSSTTEGGAYNANYFDGLRGVIGSVGAFSANNAIQVDIGSLNILESMQLAATKAANNGGMPSIAYMSMNAKQALDTEQQSNRRYNDAYQEIIPGVRVSQVMWANGELPVVPIPGTTVGTYNRTSDNALVEDIYILDERTVTARWLYSETFTVLQIPSGVDGALSNRFNEMEPSASNRCRIITLISVNILLLTSTTAKDNAEGRKCPLTLLPVTTERVTPYTRVVPQSDHRRNTVRQPEMCCPTCVLCMLVTKKHTIYHGGFRVSCSTVLQQS